MGRKSILLVSILYTSRKSKNLYIMILPTEEQIEKQIVAMMALHPEYKECGNCARCNLFLNKCEVNGMKVYSHLPAMQCKNYITNKELIIRETMKRLRSQQLECDKIENLLALSVTVANSATCFLADLEKRMKAFRKDADGQELKREMKKDLDMVSEISNAMSMMQKELNAMSKDMQKHLDKVDNYYHWYVEPHLDRMFSTDGVLNQSKTDGHLNNSMEFCRLIVDFVIGCIGNSKNCDKVFKMLRELKNDQPYALTHEDADHYKLRGYNG